MKLDFTNKVVVITGGAKGIGLETAKMLAEKGAKLAICDVDTDAGEKAVSELKDKGAEAIFEKLDVTSLEDVKSFFKKVMDSFGRVDVLLNNAGITADGFLVDLKEEDVDKVIDINIKGVFNCGQEAAKIMIEQGSGCILNVSSVSGVYGNIGQTNYSATKAGVIGMTKAWSKELGRKGIRVNAVAPGFIKTDMTAKVPDKVLEKMEKATPLGRLGVPEDVAKSYVFLASDDADYINGAILCVDGGLVL